MGAAANSERLRGDDLPRRPQKGNRRKLEALWLQHLERYGIHSSLVNMPAEAPRELYKAVHEFNGRLFWECHETLEDVWRDTDYPLRFFYHSVIKVAVGFHHMSRHNRHGARVKLLDGIRLLRLFQPRFLGLRTDDLLAETSAWPARLTGSNDMAWTELDTLPTPVIRMSRQGDVDEATAR